MILHVARCDTFAVSVASLPGEAGDETETSFTFAEADAGTASPATARRAIRPLRMSSLQESLSNCPRPQRAASIAASARRRRPRWHRLINLTREASPTSLTTSLTQPERPHPQAGVLHRRPRGSRA